jgi:hypothetical protein
LRADGFAPGFVGPLPATFEPPRLPAKLGNKFERTPLPLAEDDDGRFTAPNELPNRVANDDGEAGLDELRGVLDAALGKRFTTLGNRFAVTPDEPFPVLGKRFTILGNRFAVGELPALPPSVRPNDEPRFELVALGDRFTPLRLRCTAEAALLPKFEGSRLAVDGVLRFKPKLGVLRLKLGVERLKLGAD